MDELLLSKIRLAIIGQLVTAQWVTFAELKQSIEATNGNLGAHLAKLVVSGSDRCSGEEYGQDRCGREGESHALNSFVVNALRWQYITAPPPFAHAPRLNIDAAPV